MQLLKWSFFSVSAENLPLQQNESMLYTAEDFECVPMIDDSNDANPCNVAEEYNDPVSEAPAQLQTLRRSLIPLTPPYADQRSVVSYSDRKYF